MTDDLTAQVAEAMTDVLPERMFGPLAGALAPRVAACMRAVEDAAWVRGQRGDVTAFGEERTWAAGLQALRMAEGRPTHTTEAP